MPHYIINYIRKLKIKVIIKKEDSEQDWTPYIPPAFRYLKAEDIYFKKKKKKKNNNNEAGEVI